MSDTITTSVNDIEILDKEMREMEEAAARAAAELDARRKRIAELKAEQDRRLNDPAERAKLFVNANKLIEDGIKEYEAKGYKVNVVFDENNLFEKLVFKFGKSRKSGTRGPRKSAGQEDFIPAMTRDQFAEIYPSLGNDFNNQKIVDALVPKFGGGKYTSFRTQPSLGKILTEGYEGIKIEKVGSKGRNVYYKKIS
jgi:hypothetical protein